MIDLLDKLLGRLDADYADLRASDFSTDSVSIKNGEVHSAVSGSMKVVSARVLIKGSWGFASTNSPEKAEEMALSAQKLAKIAHRRSLESALSDEKAFRDRVRIKPKRNPADVAMDDKIADVLELNKGMPIDKRIVSYETSYMDAAGSDYFINSEGGRIIFEPVYTMVTYSAYAKDGTVVNMRENCGGQGGYELLNGARDKAAETSRRALDALAASVVKSGKYDVVLDHRMAGVLAHEAIGHACEADSVLTGESTLKGMVGKRIGSGHATIVDDATIPGAFGSYPYDDEGVPGKKKILIEEGVLKGYLHSRETAQRMGTKSTGNARAQSVGHFPIVRMSNTYFARGDHRFGELLDGVGLYVEGLKGGAVDISTGSFQFAAELGRLVENGELKETVRDITLFGNIRETLRSVDGVDRDFRGFNPGLCGKGMQMVRVADGGAHVRIRGVRVGGA